MENDEAKDEIKIQASLALPTFRCLEKDCETIFAIVTIVPGGEDKDFNEYGSTYFFWGNPEYPPFCPHCGKKNTTRKTV